MSFINHLLMVLSKAYPNGFKKRVKKLLLYGGYDIKEKQYVGLSFLISLIIIVSTITYYYFFGLHWLLILISIGSIILIHALFFLVPLFKSESRVRVVEAYLPDFLSLMAANIRSGMNPLSAMMSAAKEDFGILSEEIEDSIAVSMGSESYERILNELIDKINSTILNRVVKLLIIGMKTGGEIADLLEGSAEEVIRMSSLKDELITSVKSYVIFIALVVIVGLPFLLNVSIHFVQTIQGLQTFITPSSDFVSSSPFSVINPSFLNIISYVVIICTSFFTSMLIGSIIDNSFTQGLKYLIPLMIISILIFIISNNFVPNIISSFGNL